MHRACVDGTEDLSAEAIDVIKRADLLVGPYIEDTDPATVDAWLTVRTLAYSTYVSEGSSAEGEETPQRPEGTGTIRLPPSSPTKLRAANPAIDDNVDMDDGEETASKAKPKRKITAIGPIGSPSKSQEGKTVAPSSMTNKIPSKPSVEHELFVAGRHILWPKSVSYFFSSLLFAYLWTN